MSLCRGGCGTDLIGKPSLFGLCYPCIEASPPIDPKEAWAETMNRRQLTEPKNLSEMTEDYYANVYVPPVESVEVQERYER